MKSDEQKIRVPDIAESVFEVIYLEFDLMAGLFFLMLAEENTIMKLYGCLCLVLGIGDAFHLIPRVSKAIYGETDRIRKHMGRGLQISSITMTIFYVLLLYIWKCTFPELRSPVVIDILIWASAIVRIVICLLPQNNWLGDGNMKLSLIRNGVFLITGIGVIILYAISGNTNGYGMYKMVIAIIISFACYIPVTLLAKKKPKIGILMIPKTCAYMWMIIMGINLMFIFDL